MIRRFFLHRKRDVSGVSGTGVVAEGAQYTNGKVVLVWLSEMPTLSVHEDMDTIYQIHGHEGSTDVVWIDKEE